MKNSHHISNTFLSLSPNELYICSTDISTGWISLWNVRSKKISKIIYTNESGLLTHTWSADSKYVMVFGCHSGAIYQFQVSSNVSLIRVIYTNFTYIYSSFYNYETS